MELEFRYRFEAAHRFLKSESIPCMTPHGHSWYATMAVKFNGSKLDQNQMSVEFSKVKRNWKHLIQETLDHSYLHNINDPVVEVLSLQDQSPRLIPFPGDPTTELISLFLFHKMEQTIKAEIFNDQLTLAAIKIEETPTNSIVCAREFYLNEIERFSQFDGWWNSTDPSDRSFRGTM